jgi:sn-glycerol 3-phosphate transport system substrate-binding protein
MGGANGTAVATLTDQFNDSQTDIYVDAIFQGNYDDNLNKFKAGLPAKQGPHIIQIYDIGQRFMIDSQAIEPMQTFIDADKFDTSQFEAAILNYYTTDKKLYAMPFNTSNPILYYNKKAFTDAGLDPAKAPKTWEDIQATAEKLVKKDSAGKVTQYGIAIAIYGWFFEQWLATQNQLYANNDNGRGATRADKLVYNSDAGVKIIDWWKGLIDKGFAQNLGRNTSDTQKAFTAGQIPMTIDSTAALRGIVAGVGDKFEVATAYMPRPAATVDQGGIIMGGASNYILKDKADKEKQAAWKFVQWLAQPKQQAFWHIATGYFPIRKDVYDLPEEVENTKKYPQFTTAINQLHDTKLTPATTGAILGIFAQARASTETAIEEAILGKSTNKAALDKSVADMNQALELYNASVPK